MSIIFIKQILIVCVLNFILGNFTNADELNNIGNNHDKSLKYNQEAPKYLVNTKSSTNKYNVKQWEKILTQQVIYGTDAKFNLTTCVIQSISISKKLSVCEAKLLDAKLEKELIKKCVSDVALFDPIAVFSMVNFLGQIYYYRFDLAATPLTFSFNEIEEICKGIGMTVAKVNVANYSHFNRFILTVLNIPAGTPIPLLLDNGECINLVMASTATLFAEAKRTCSPTAVYKIYFCVATPFCNPYLMGELFE